MDDTPRSGQRRHHRHPTSRRLPSPHPALGAQVSPACPVLTCLSLPVRVPASDTGKDTHTIEGETPRTKGDIPNVRCVAVVVVDQPSTTDQSNRINESNCNQLRIESTNRIEPSDQPRQSAGPPPADPALRQNLAWVGADFGATRTQPPSTSRNIHPTEKYSSSYPHPCHPLPPRPLHPKVLWAPFSALRNDRGWGHPRAAQGPHRATNTPGSTTAGANESHLRRCTHSPNPVVTTSKIGDQ